MIEVAGRGATDFDAMTYDEFEAYPDSPEKKEYIASIYLAQI